MSLYALLVLVALSAAAMAATSHTDTAAELAAGFERLKREIHTLPLPEAKRRLDELRALGVGPPPHQVWINRLLFTIL